MPYSPPGVETRVIIDSTTVTLPGGTRILSLIGNGDRTKSVSGEALVQPDSRIVEVTNSGLSNIQRVYDFSGPGSSLYTYPTSGAGAFGSGYYQSGNSILWTVSANPYPSSTTPTSTTTYFVDYNYSGVASSEAHTSPTLASGVGNLLDITDVTDVVTVSGALVTFPEAAVDPSGAGWYLSGNTLLWSLGTDWATFTAGAAVGVFPSGQSQIYVNYTYSGTAIAESHVHSGTYSNQLDIPTVNSIIAVSGATSAYPASGTVTAPDTSGYGTSGSGYYQSGNFINWNAVDPAAYGYPAATVVPVSGVFYVDYTYTKQATDYNAKNFVSFNNVVSEYGNIATWNLITSGPTAGSYELVSINPLTLGAQVAFQNNASVLMLVQNEGAGTSAGDFLDSLSKLETKIVDVIVPLTIGSGNVQNAMSIDQRALALNYTKLHCETMSNEVNHKERVSLGSLGVANVGDATTEDTYIYTASVALDSKRIALVAPGTTTVQLQDPAGVFQDVDIDGCFLATAAASISVSPLNDVATPLTNKELVGFTQISAVSPDHPSQDYLAVEMNNLAAAGVMVIASEGPRIFVRHQLTTDQSNVVNGEFSVVTLIDYVAQAVRFSCNQYIGKKLKPATTIPAVRGTILATLQTLAQNDIISSIGGITVQINPLNPTELLVEASYVPIFPLNRIKVTFTIRTLG